MTHRFLRFSLVACGLLVAFYGCKESPSPGIGDDTSGGASEGGGSSKGDTSLAGADQSGAGAPQAGGGTGPDESLGGRPDQAGGAATTGGTGEGGLGQVETSEAGAGGQSADPVVEHRPDLKGSIEDDQHATLLTADKQFGDGIVTKIVVDGAGNTYVLWQSGDIGLYDASFERKWLLSKTSPTPAGVIIGDLSLASDGGVFVSGRISSGYNLSGEVAAGGNDAVEGRVSAEGELLWMHQWGHSGSDDAVAVAALPNGASVHGSDCAGQAPGSPVSAKGGSVLARYDSAGLRTWIKQTRTSPPSSGSLLDLVVNKSGHILALDSTQLRYYSPDGVLERMSFASRYYVAGDDGNLVADGAPVVDDGTPVPASGRYVALDPVAETAYLWGTYDHRVSDPILALVAVDRTGKYRWFRKTVAPRTAVVDQVEGVIWTGRFYSGTSIAATSDAIYVGGRYTNSYQNGSIVRPTTQNGFVAKLDLKGNTIWFRQFITERSDYPGSKWLPDPMAIAIDPDGNPVVAFSIWIAIGGWRLVRLSAVDGATLQ